VGATKTPEQEECIGASSEVSRFEYQARVEESEKLPGREKNGNKKKGCFIIQPLSQGQQKRNGLVANWLRFTNYIHCKYHISWIFVSNLACTLGPTFFQGPAVGESAYTFTF
jgi:hypothetical protein